MKTVCHKVFALIMAIALTCSSCRDFLDIVPDNVATLDMAFNTRTTAKQYLFTCYSYLPDIQSPNGNPALWGGDEMISYTVYINSRSVESWYIQKSAQTASDSRCNFWQGSKGGKNLFRAIRECNIFLENIDLVPDVEQWEKDQWKAEVTFLKAYYHFYLLRMYGPIPIVDTNLDINALPSKAHVYRNTMDECFDYIVNTLDKILKENKLPDVIQNEASEMGRITNGIVRAVKAEVLVYAASPLFNGNTDYRNLKDNRGVEFFCPDKTDAEKLARWEQAAAACKDAIDFLESNGFSLYHFESPTVPEDTKYKLNIRGALTEAWNSEIIWGYTRTRVQELQLQAVPRGLFSSSWTIQGNGSANLKIANLFYTKNGLPIDQDVTWNYGNRLVPRTATDAEKYLLKTGYTTIGLHFDREYRYYADLGFDGGVWYQAGYTNENSPAYLQAKKGQASCPGNLNDYNMTGYWIKKWLNPKTTINTSNYFSYIDYAFPIIRLTGLYLYYAEALNESGADYGTVLPWIDAVRERAGIPDVATSWDQYSQSPGRYKTKDGLREIIHRERTVELAFEGQRFWDLRRWKEAYSECNQSFTGWTMNGKTVEDYYKENLVLEQTFEIKDYFWPIPHTELVRNPNLVQNYGW